MGFVKDFKAFISRGNVVDMAVGVVVGGAFGKIVSSLVADIITPLISCATKGANLKELYYCINPNAVEGQTFTYAAYPTVAAAHDAGYATMNYLAKKENAPILQLPDKPTISEGTYAIRARKNSGFSLSIFSNQPCFSSSIVGSFTLSNIFVALDLRSLA